MKKIAVISAFFFISITLWCQDHIITFSGSGASNNVDSVTVQNLTRGTTIKMGGQDTLVLTKSTWINPVKDTELLPLKVYPNPFSSECYLTFSVLKNENVLIRIFGISGKLVTSKKQFLEKGSHSFSLKGLPQGLLAVQVNSSVHFQPTKILSFSTSTGNPGIMYEGRQNNPQFISALKSASDDTPQTLTYQEGDEIMITGESTDPITGQTNTTVETFKMTEDAEIEENIEFEFVECIDKDGKSYAIVEIGDQVWMTENYAYDAGEGSWVYDEDENNVSTYGRLYTWEVAMNNAPAGWHLPTSEEWNNMQQYVQNTYDDNVAVALKAKTGWLPGENQTPMNGSNASGFNVFPAGAWYFVNESFYNMGKVAYFWTATKQTEDMATIRRFPGVQSDIGAGSSTVDYGFSVRYIKDNSIPEVETHTASEITNKSAILKGSIKNNGGSTITESGIIWSITNKTPNPDDNMILANSTEEEFAIPLADLESDTTYYFRAFAANINGIALGKVLMFKTNCENDTIKYGSELFGGNIYKTVTIGEQTWMAENLKTQSGISSIAFTSNEMPLCYVYGWTAADHNMSFYSKYGTLYNWPAAMFYCPDGWHLPTYDEWEQLEDYVYDNYGRSHIGLAANTNWFEIEENDDFNKTGFSAVPGGMAQNEIEKYVHAGRSGYYWTSSPKKNAYGVYTLAYYWAISSYDNKVEPWSDFMNKFRGLSVRYVKDK